MRVAVISDMHGNLLALDAVLAELDATGPYDAVVIGGDLAFGGPRPAECIDRIRERGFPAVRGNTDEFIVELATGGRIPARVAHESQRHTASEPMLQRYRWTVERLAAEQIEYLVSLPLAWVIPSPAGRALTVAHATPWNAHDTVREGAPEELARRMLDQAGGQALAYGHIHVQYQRRVDGRLLAAVGSVGLPFDGDRRAAYAVFTLGEDGWAVEFRRVAYDVERALEETLASGMPGAEFQAAILRAARPPGA
ncbi:metallophosphatase family protein [Thermomicrobiaceae bacterium CFH 74404]|uniref:Metallophosphatase family protein n=1 Tax=Thermalbibacter longus TaxID=2951981 RepID=A0AA42BCB7_9BACT|nr:metallophosphoesterase family protein [Thermalbibacter longus]MCM8748608.1 metallophosphatase family protein [Thermalbibacter longus]